MLILAISGSLRASSSNTALLQAAAILAPRGVEVVLYGGLGNLPHFNPDLDGEMAPPAVGDWRSRLRNSDGVVFSVPEYAHGVPGTLKNGLDWVVGSGEFVDKPVTLFNASARGTFAQASLTETLTVMSAKMAHKASVTLQLLGKPVTAGQIAADPEMSAVLRSALEELACAIKGDRALDSSPQRE
jgi:chromate reductase, NAD(P)H dehydrogenase (quinone)